MKNDHTYHCAECQRPTQGSERDKQVKRLCPGCAAALVPSTRGFGFVVKPTG